MSNSPVVRPRAVKRLFFERFPDGLRPGRLSRLYAHSGTAVERGVPLVLFFGHGGWPTAVAAAALICFHPVILTAIPMGVPLEWNVFMIFAVAAMPAAQLERYYGSREAAQILLYLGYAFRALNTHGKALFTPAHRAMAGQNEDDYTLTDGERICSTALGWNFGDGHLHNEQLITALQQRCGFEPGEVRVVLLDAQPIHRQIQRYHLVDAATGEFERGYVRVADMVVRQPWDDDLPVYPAERRQ